MKSAAVLLWIGLLMAPGLCSAPRQTVDAKRIGQIWDAAEDRIRRQNDKWFKDGQFPRCVQSLRLKLELNPNDYEAVTDLGYMLENIERNDEALALYIRFRLSASGNPDAPWPEANFYFHRGAYAKVPPLIEPTLKRHPHANSYRLLAHSYEKLGMFSDSRRIWDLYLEINPKDEVAKNNQRRVKNLMKGVAGAPKMKP